MRLPEFMDQANSCRQRQSGSSTCRAASSLLGLLIGGAPALMIARPPSLQKLLGNDEIISSVSPRSNALSIRSRPA
jgi:hypothetical protein